MENDVRYCVVVKMSDEVLEGRECDGEQVVNVNGMMNRKTRKETINYMTREMKITRLDDQE